MKCRTRAWYAAHPNADYWCRKAHAEWRRIVKDRADGLCEKCVKPGCDPHHLLTKGAYPKYRHEPLNGMWLCKGCHNFHKGSAHRDPYGFLEWLEEHWPEVLAWMDGARKDDSPRVKTRMEEYQCLLATNAEQK